LILAQPVWRLGTVQSVEKKAESTPRTYLWDVVVTSTDVITYRLYITAGSKTYITDYTPEIQPSGLPAACEVGHVLQFRQEKRRLLIQTSFGELTTFIQSIR
jgi:hypothetical protein